MTDQLSPMGYFYKFDPEAGLARKRPGDPHWSIGFSVQEMTPEELRHVAGVMDAALVDRF